jgi:hypothetical protein
MANETNPDETWGLPDDVASAWADVVIDVFEKRHKRTNPAFRHIRNEMPLLTSDYARSNIVLTFVINVRPEAR